MSRAPMADGFAPLPEHRVALWAGYPTFDGGWFPGVVGLMSEEIRLDWVGSPTPTVKRPAEVLTMGLMDLLQGDDDRNDFRDFSDRFDRGRPHEGYDEREAYERYERVNRHLDHDEYEHSARDAFSRLSPQERRQLGRELRERSSERGYRFDDDDDDDDGRYEDAGYLARHSRRMREQDPGMLGSLLGGGGGGLGGVLGGGGGGGGAGGMLAKVALGGIAAMAAKRAMDR